jgi:hypothetical protein
LWGGEELNQDPVKSKATNNLIPHIFAIYVKVSIKYQKGEQINLFRCKELNQTDVKSKIIEITILDFAS